MQPKIQETWQTHTHTHTHALTHTVIVDPLTHTKATVAKVKFDVFSFIYSLATACIFYFIDVWGHT